MKKVFRLAFMLILFCSCKKEREPEVLVQPIILESLGNYEKQSFVEPFFHQMHFGYPLNSHDKLGRPISDSLKFFYTAEVMIVLKQYNQSFSLLNCNAIANKGNLFIQLSDNPFNESSFGLELIKQKGEFIIKCKQTRMPTDSSAKMPIFTVIKQTSFFNKENYSAGDSLKVKFTASILASHPFSDREATKDTMNVYGLIRTIVR